MYIYFMNAWPGLKSYQALNILTVTHNYNTK